MDSFELEQIVEPLLTWFGSHARILPWREEPTAYRVWVSEIMLQQTRVEAVKPYYERFMNALPTVEALAAAPEETLLKLWRGLDIIIVSAIWGRQRDRSWNSIMV